MYVVGPLRGGCTIFSGAAGARFAYDVGMPDASMSFPSGLHTVRAARHFLESTLAEWGTDDYDFGAPQVLSELATNAALHARSPFSVALRLEDDSLYIAVRDASKRLPRQCYFSQEATTGRGLGLIAALSLEWGTAMVDGGKTVWARVAPDGSGLTTTDWSDLLEDVPPSRTDPAANGRNVVTAMSAA